MGKPVLSKAEIIQIKSHTRIQPFCNAISDFRINTNIKRFASKT